MSGCLVLISFLCFLGKDVVWCVVCLLLISFLCFLGKENGSAYYGSCCGLRGSFAEDAVPAEVFVRTWDGTERRCTEHDFSHVPFWSVSGYFYFNDLTLL